MVCAVGHQQVLHRRGDLRRRLRPPAAPSARGSARTIRRRRCRRAPGWPSRTARTGPPRPCRSLITGPWRVSRTVSTSSGWPRTLMRSWRTRRAWDRPGSGTASVPTGVSMNTSCVSAPVVVKVQAMWPLWPITRPGMPGAVAPASVWSGVSMRARYQMPGKPNARCGSPASSGAPVAVWRPSTAHSLDAVLGRVNGAGEVRQHLLQPAAASANWRGSDSAPAGGRGRSGPATARRSSAAARGRPAPGGTARCASSATATGPWSCPTAGSRPASRRPGAPSSRNSGAAKRPRSAIQAFTPLA